MDQTKAVKIGQYLVFFFLVLFPFGQIIRTSLSFGYFKVTIQPIDLVAGASFFLLPFLKLKKPEITKEIKAFLWAALFSYFFSLTLFQEAQVLVGAFYFLRLVFYFGFFLLLFNLCLIK